MTREEAIQRFNGIINAMSISIAQSKFYPSKAELNELCDMAIEALSSAELPKGELISRADAIAYIERVINSGLGRNKSLDYIHKYISALPSAEAVTIHNDGTLEVKVPKAHKVGRVLVMDTDSYIGGGLFYPDDAVQGEWIEVEDYNGDVHYKCDQCGEEWTFPFGTPIENNANFCPNCGARMKGGGNE